MRRWTSETARRRVPASPITPRRDRCPCPTSRREFRRPCARGVRRSGATRTAGRPPRSCPGSAYGLAEVARRRRRAGAGSTRCWRPLFPELETGRIDSPLLALAAGRRRPCLRRRRGPAVWVKADHDLPVTGCIKARGGVYEVLVTAERLALAAGLAARGRILCPPGRARRSGRPSAPSPWRWAAPAISASASG